MLGNCDLNIRNYLQKDLNVGYSSTELQKELEPIKNSCLECKDYFDYQNKIHTDIKEFVFNKDNCELYDNDLDFFMLDYEFEVLPRENIKIYINKSRKLFMKLNLIYEVDKYESKSERAELFLNYTKMSVNFKQDTTGSYKIELNKIDTRRELLTL